METIVRLTFPCSSDERINDDFSRTIEWLSLIEFELTTVMQTETITKNSLPRPENRKKKPSVIIRLDALYQYCSIMCAAHRQSSLF